MASINLPQLPGFYIPSLRRRISPQRMRARRERMRDPDFIIVMGLMPVSPRLPPTAKSPSSVPSGRTTVQRNEARLPPLPRERRGVSLNCTTVRYREEDNRARPEALEAPLAPSTESLSRWGEV